VQGDHREFEKRADLLRAAGVNWDQDPVVRQVATARLAATREQAERGLQKGRVDFRPGVTPEDIIAKAVGQQQAAQAGGTPPSAEDLAGEIRAAARHPERLTEDGALALAERFNRELDALSRAEKGLWG
jgi:hypothetical protein